ncbi:MAG: efflux RND transporter periplasmic adaptor subunit [Verrucomicrobiota bacterium]|jgi:RND family efflux transporter MFP subunit
MNTNLKRRGIWALVAAAILVAVVCFYPRKQAKATGEASESLAPSAPAARVEREDLVQSEVIPAEFRPYVAVDLHAKVSGYLDLMNVDFGDHVNAGQLLATIEVPELRDQLNNAIAVQQRAEADYTNAHLIYTRLVNVNKEHPDLVAQQDVDTATAKDLAALAQIAAAKADVGRYQTLTGYTNITAPFEGVITHRYVDPGALVEAGTSTANTQPLLEVSDNYHLRLDFPVSVAYVKNIQVGDTITGTVESLGARSFSGKITRATWKVNDATRTMTTEIEVANPDLKLVPGMYASVSIPVECRPLALVVPIEAVPPGETSSVYVINSNGEIEDRPVKLGIQTPTKFEVLSGLKEGELVLTGSRSLFKPGQKVVPKLLDPLAQQE